MLNRLAHINATRTNEPEPRRFGDVRRLQPLYLPPPDSQASPLTATEFVDRLRSSICLDTLEKCYLLQRLPSLPQQKVERCIAIWRTELRRFRNLPDSYQAVLLASEVRALTEWWKVEHWFWQHGRISCQPMLFIGAADPKLPANVEFLLQQLTSP